MASFSFQGISDRVAAQFMARHGSVRWNDIALALGEPQTCGKLRSYWSFDRCGYEKTSFNCSNPDAINQCSLPKTLLRNGRLNQTAFSFFLFIRDIAKGDFIGWMNCILAETEAKKLSGSEAADDLVQKLRHVYGVSDKILTMSLSTLLLGWSKHSPRHFEVGASMVTIDTLVHNFLHRTGILADHDCDHTYGAKCYGPGGCADLMRSIAAEIDARRFNPIFPRTFPRFVQHAVWRYCAASGSAICNGNRIADQKSCEISYCHLFENCQKIPLKSQ